MPSNPLQSHKGLLASVSWISFGISLAFYWITCDPDVSYWDCPEYVTVASRLEVGHPPGNPVWMLAMRVATIPFNVNHHAYVINLCSGLLMAFAVFFLARVIFTLLVSLSIRGNISSSSRPALTCKALTAMGASLCFALCDSAWFSAVEAEVYAMSTFLSSLSIWIMTLWWFENSAGKRARLLILLAYLTGLSLGVHQLNLLLIPLFAFIILYRIHPGRINALIISAWLFFSFALVAFLLLGLIPFLLRGAGKFELFGVNTLGLPYHSGLFLFVTLLTILLILALIFSSQPASPFKLIFKKRKDPPISASTALYMLSFIILGFSSYGVIMLRSASHPPLNEGVPDNIFALSSYIGREQYPSTPLLYGATPFSRPLFEEKTIDGKPYYNSYRLRKESPVFQIYQPGAMLNHRSGMLQHEDSIWNAKVQQNGRGYILSDYRFSHELTPELDMWFPRITSRNPGYLEDYANWAGMTPETMEKIPVSETVNHKGEYVARKDGHGERHEGYSYRPTYGQHLRYFLSYQAYYMYFRYLFWNFIGRQNDYASNGEIDHGNFITGVNFIDSVMIGDPRIMPQEIWGSNKGRNRYFAIPFILGIIGVIALFTGSRCHRRVLTLITLMFFMTGLAIVIYLNQNPGEPRERDYTFLISYMAFTIWIACGIMALSDLLLKRNLRIPALAVGMIFSLGTPALMAIENFDDHDRRGRFQTAYFASALLDFEEPAIIFSHGDNLSFPLWYLSEVTHRDNPHTIVDITYLSLPSYVSNLKKQADKGLRTIAAVSDINYGNYLLTRIPEDSVSPPLYLRDALERLYSSGQSLFPSSKIIIPTSEGSPAIVSLRDITAGSSYLTFRQLMLLDILAGTLSSPKPEILFFPNQIGHGFHKALEPALKTVPFGKIYAPLLSDSALNLLRKNIISREIRKFKKEKKNTRYSDPLISDVTARYRGELIMAANDFISTGDTSSAIEIAEFIKKEIPYSHTYPGNFTQADSTYHEGEEYLKLLENLSLLTGEQNYREDAHSLDSLMENRRKEWLRYYHGLNTGQRKALSNRGKRLLRR